MLCALENGIEQGEGSEQQSRYDRHSRARASALQAHSLARQERARRDSRRIAVENTLHTQVHTITFNHLGTIREVSPLPQLIQGMKWVRMEQMWGKRGLEETDDGHKTERMDAANRRAGGSKGEGEGENRIVYILRITVDDPLGNGHVSTPVAVHNLVISIIGVFNRLALVMDGCQQSSKCAYMYSSVCREGFLLQIACTINAFRSFKREFTRI